VAIVALWATGCSFWEEPICADMTGDVTPGGPSCAAADDIRAYADLLAARSMAKHERERLYAAVAADPAAFEALRSQVNARAAEITGADPLQGALLRSADVFELHLGEGLLNKAQWPSAHAITLRHVAVWSIDRDDELALSEMDIEHWIRFASLCREVQGGSPLKLSVADRVGVYQSVQDAFDAGSRADRRAMVQLGAVWPAVGRGWKSASYETQQRWIQSVPLPPPMTADSPEYMAAVSKLSMVKRVDPTLRLLGPLSLEQPR